MVTYAISEIKDSPTIIQNLEYGEIIDKQDEKVIGYFISSKYDKYIKPILNKIDRDEKLKKLQTLKRHQDLEFAEVGVDDGL